MKTLVFIILLIMVWKGSALCAEDKPTEHQVPEWLENWHQEFEEEERQQEEEIRKRLRARDPREDEGREGLA